MAPAPAAPETPQLAASTLYAAVERLDITPPVGMYNRMWGAAATDVSTGVHRPITANLLALRQSPTAPAALLISIDWCITPPGPEFEALMAPTRERVGDPARVILACTHTHGVGFLSRSRSELPGGAGIGPYLDGVRDQLAAATERLLAASAQADAACVATWAYGLCDLATNRDLTDPAPDADRVVTGWAPGAPADHTLLVGRVTRAADAHPLATIVNYACHPTTLAWENTQLSPDYIGAMRELVETETAGAPTLFLQGASGELAPANQYVGDTAIADRHGRRLGHAVLATLAGMEDPGHALAYTGVVESGAPLAVWRPQPTELADTLSADAYTVDIPLKDMPTPDELRAQMDAATDRFTGERLRRKLQQVELFGNKPSHPLPVWDWRIGPVRLVATPAEPYSQLQTQLRDTHPQPVAVVNVANGWAGYLPPTPAYATNTYAVWQTPFAAGCLESLIARLQG